MPAPHGTGPDPVCIAVTAFLPVVGLEPQSTTALAVALSIRKQEAQANMCILQQYTGPSRNAGVCLAGSNVCSYNGYRGRKKRARRFVEAMSRTHADLSITADCLAVNASITRARRRISLTIDSSGLQVRFCARRFSGNRYQVSVSRAAASAAFTRSPVPQAPCCRQLDRLTRQLTLEGVIRRIFPLPRCILQPDPELTSSHRMSCRCLTTIRHPCHWRPRRPGRSAAAACMPAAAIERIATDMAASTGLQPAVVITGGDAQRLVPLLGLVARYDADMVLKGIAILAGEH